MTNELSIMLTGHGERRCTADDFDMAISRHLPGSPYTLRQKIDAHPNNGFGPGHYNQLVTVTEYLMVLAELDARSRA